MSDDFPFRDLRTEEECRNLQLVGSNIIVTRYKPSDRMTPDSLIVLPVQFMEFKTPGGMSSPHDNPRVEVLNVGPGERLEGGELEDMQGIKPGDIGLCDSVVSDQRNLIGKTESGEGIYIIHIKLLEAFIKKEDL